MATQTTTVTGQQAIPTELMPYFTGTGGVAGLLPKAQEIFSQNYSGQYGAPMAAAGLAGTQRVAGLSPMQQQLGTQIGQMQTPTQFGMGSGAAGAGAGTGTGASYLARLGLRPIGTTKPMLTTTSWNSSLVTAGVSLKWLL
jgi:hypothetical protein